MKVLGLSAETVGLTLATYGVGMVIGALGAGALLRAMNFGYAILLGPIMSVLAMMSMVATLQWPSPMLAALSYFLFGVGPIVWTITSTTLRQTVTPEALIGRVTSLFLMVNMGALPLGAALGAWVGGTWGEAACLIVALGGFVVQALIVSVSALSRLKSLPSA
jgi:predicted MFS family arabinose efflux permease